ncbi:hypothetical protein IGI39_004014 [Enterococcus sp. AZ135]|uniref:hypothetical protein n=1 Tax=unclassified Enterococcus TaxID=2608891 RepID=UPI003F248D47
MEEKSKMNQINNLAFDIMHETNQAEPFDRAAEIYQLSLRPKLNENQQVVLEWLKWSVEEQGSSSMDAVYLLALGETLVSVSLAYIALTPDQQTQVIAVFSKEVAE